MSREGMGLNTIAFAHLRRHLGKSVLVIVGLTTAVAAFVAVMSLVLSLQSTMDDKLARFGASLTVTPRSPELSLEYGGVTVATAGTADTELLDAGVVAAIEAIASRDRLTAVIPVLLQPVELSGTDYLAMGTDIAASAAVKPWWHVEGTLPAQAGEVLLGLRARNSLGAEVGTTLTIRGKPYRVSGVLWETGGEEDNAVLMAHDELARITSAGGQLNLVEVTVSGSEAVDAIAAEIEQALPAVEVRSVKKTLEFNAQANSSLADLGLAATVLIVLVAAAIVVLTMLASVRERQKEIGVLRALGFRARDVVSLIYRESLLLSGIAAVAGVALGLLGAAFGPRVVPGLDLDLVISVPVIAGGVALSVVLAALATFYPAAVAARLSPAIALRRL